MKIISARDVLIEERNEAGSVRGGGPNSHIAQPIFDDDTPDHLSFTLRRSQWLSGDDEVITSPRHHHAFQQIRWTESGKVNYAPGQDILEGDLGYFPRGTFYGPQVRDQGTVLTLQFGFNAEKQHGIPYWDQFRGEALDKLRANGIFRGGIYLDRDPLTGEERERDGVQALYEEQYFAATGEEYVIPAEGYDAPIHIHTSAFAYYQESPGVEVKWFGRFFDHPGPEADICLSMLRLSQGGAFTFDASRAQIAWTKDAGLTVDGKTYPELTYVYSPRGEETTLVGVSPIEMQIVEFPRLD